MVTTNNFHAEMAAHTFVDWWKLAGVEYLVENEPINWLDDAHAQPAAPITADKSAEVEPKPVNATGENLPWPTLIEELRELLKRDRGLPGNGHGMASALPTGSPRADFMIISDFPEESEIAAGEMGELPLLQNMLRAAGIARENCYFAALAYSRPASGALRDVDKPMLGKFILHQIDLVEPQKILLLGTSAADVLLGMDLMQARGNLGKINHVVRNKAASATFHPRTLLAQPILKAKVWADLWMFMQEDSA